MTDIVVDVGHFRFVATDIAGDGPPIIVVHGFLGSATTMEELCAGLAPRRTIAVDLVGHGRSDAPENLGAYTVESSVRHLAALVDSVGFADVDLVGYSMGGRVALAFATHHGERVRRMVVIGANPGIEDPLERAQRIQNDDVLAALVDEEGVAAFVDRWEAQSIFASQATLSPERRAAVRAGRAGQRAVGIANTLRAAGAGRMPSMWSELATLDVPTLAVAGELDTRYVAIGRRLADTMVHGELAVIADVGHAAHVEAPESTAAIIRAFLDR